MSKAEIAHATALTAGAMLVLLVSGCSTSRMGGSSDRLEQIGGNRWKIGHQTAGPEGTIVEYIRPRESMETWTELVTVQSIPQDFLNYKTESLIHEIKGDILRDCPAAFWNTISLVPGEAIYEWRTSDCPLMGNQHELARVIFRESGIHRIAYVKKGGALSIPQRNRWLNILTARTLPFPQTKMARQW